MSDLVHVALGRNAGADVEELADAGRGEEPHRPAEEIAVGPRDRPDIGIDRGHRPAQVLVGQEIVAAAQQVVVDTGDVRSLRVNPRRYPARLVSHHASWASHGRNCRSESRLRLAGGLVAGAGRRGWGPGRAGGAGGRGWQVGLALNCWPGPGRT